ncbi:serine/threonine-protein kinase [Streptomyces sp. NPDC014870]|uniref:serine/threonine-protein kinase n=1 Tax=Streptomyces sp. NPDC014870 TaxID=3364925 RepID=UPI0036FA9BF0
MLIGTYEIERKLGEGGMGTVWLARSRGGRAVAVKVARPELAADPGFRERFRAEIVAARRVGGFHTAQVVDADPEAEAPWLATAYVPGPTLAGLVAAEGPMDERRLRGLGAALAEALEAIHGCGLVHRDLKPGNIVMAADGPRVLDFGIARALESTRLTATGSAFGTPGYLAPEQALGEEVTGAADVFALGGVLVAAAGGRVFGDGTPMGLMYRTVHEAPDLGAVPEELRELVGRCLAKNPTERPTPAELLDVLAGAGAGAQASAVAGAQAGAAPTPTVVSVPAPAAGDAVQDAVPAPTSAAGGGVQDAVPVHVPVHARPTVAVPPPPAAPPGPAPTFEAADGASGIAVDAEGVVFVIADVEAEFGWEEIGSVTYARTRRGRRLAVTLTLYDGSTYTCDVDGRGAERAAAWERHLDLVLSRYLPA